MFNSLLMFNSSGQADDLQASEVSSSRPNCIQPADISTLLLETLNCFIFTLNSEGFVDYVSDNVHKFLKYTPVSVQFCFGCCLKIISNSILFLPCSLPD